MILIRLNIIYELVFPTLDLNIMIITYIFLILKFRKIYEKKLFRITVKFKTE